MGVRAGCWLLAVTALLAACSSEEPPGALPPVPLQSPITTPSITPSLIIPSDAQADSQAGASAFVRYYFSEVNRGYQNLDSSRISDLGTASCNSCSNITQDIERLRASKLTVPGSRFRLSSAEASPPQEDGRVLVDFRYSGDPYVEVSASGQSNPAEPATVDQDAQAVLRWDQTRWSLLGLRLVGAN